MFKLTYKKSILLGVLALLILLYYFDDYRNHRVIGSIDCGLSEINVRLNIRPNALEGDGASYGVQYNTDTVKNLSIGGGDLLYLTRSRFLPINTDIAISTYSSVDSRNDLILQLPNTEYSSDADISNGITQNFTQTEFEYLDSCILQNINEINELLATVPSKVPKRVQRRSSNFEYLPAPKIKALVHFGPGQLSGLLERAGINYQIVFLSPEHEREIIRVSTSGALRFDYYSDVGINIFETDFSKPLPNEYQYLEEYESESGTPLINYLARIQTRVPINFND